MHLLFILPLFLNFYQPSSDIIFWENPSFEGEPQDATVPIGWLPCEEGTTPDILPGFWGVYKEAADDETYVGLITRQDGSWESITQRLASTIQHEDCYTFSLDLAHSKTYSGYNEPLQLRIWGSRDKCTKDQLLFESPLIDQVNWKKYLVEFTAESPIRYIILEAYRKRRGKQGNILLDNLSPLQKCPRV